jgi:ribosomal protein S27AE
MKIQDPLTHPDHVSVDDFFDGLDKLIGKDRPCPICGATDWATGHDCLATHVTQTAPDGTAVTGTIHLAMRVCQRCHFVRTHEIPSKES